MKSVAYFMGNLTQVNSVTTNRYVGAHSLADFDYIYVTLPALLEPTGWVGSGTFDFLNVIKLIGKPVWCRINVGPTPTATSAALAVRQSIQAMDYIYGVFYKYKMVGSLAGFYLDNFGFRPTAYANLSYLTRLQQNELIGYAHTQYRLPVTVDTTYPSESFAEVGPSVYGGTDAEEPVWRTLLGLNPAIQDVIMIRNPLDLATNQALKAVESLQLKQMLHEFKNVEFVCVQGLDLTTVVSDNTIGLSIPNMRRDQIRNIFLFLTSMGFKNIGFTDLLPTSSKLLMADDLFRYPPYYIPDSDATIYSLSGSYYVNLKNNDNDYRLKFSNDFTFLSVYDPNIKNWDMVLITDPSLGTEILKHQFNDDSYIIPLDFQGSYAFCQTPPSEFAQSFCITLDGVIIGYIDFAVDETIGVFTEIASRNILTNQDISIYLNPNINLDPDFSNVAIKLNLEKHEASREP